MYSCDVVGETPGPAPSPPAKLGTSRVFPRDAAISRRRVVKGSSSPSASAACVWYVERVYHRAVIVRLTAHGHIYGKLLARVDRLIHAVALSS